MLLDRVANVLLNEQVVQLTEASFKEKTMEDEKGRPMTYWGGKPEGESPPSPSPQVELPQELIEKFEKSGFCPHDAIRGRPETGTAWNTLEIEFDAGSESRYSKQLLTGSKA